MQVLGFALALAAAVPAAAQPEAPPVQAVWRAYQWSGRPYRRDDCAPALSALRETLDAVGARRQSLRCSWNYGLTASWEALGPVRESAMRDAVSRAVARSEPREGGQWLSGLSRLWEGAADPAVAARWRRVGWQTSFAGGRGCSVHAEVLDELLARLSVKVVNLNVFCQGGSGVISVDLETLAPVDGIGP